MLFFYEDLRIDEDTKTLEIFFNFTYGEKSSKFSFQKLCGLCVSKLVRDA